MEKKEDRTKYTTNLRTDLLKELKKLAIDEGRRHNDLLEDAIEMYLKKHRPPKKD